MVQRTGWRNRWRIPVKGAGASARPGDAEPSTRGPRLGLVRTLMQPALAVIAAIVLGVLAQRAWQGWQGRPRDAGPATAPRSALAPASASSGPRPMPAYNVIPMHPEPVHPNALVRQCDLGGQLILTQRECPPGSIPLPIDLPPGWTPPPPLPPAKTPCEAFARELRGLEELAQEYRDEPTQQRIQAQMRIRRDAMADLHCK